MSKTFYFLVLFVLIAHTVSAQEVDSIIVTDSIVIPDGIMARPENKLVNDSALFPFFRKLNQLEKTKKGKINIVHIGDSHIQADFITAVVRDSLQKHFGNGGRGLVFPYTLAKTNGSLDVKFSSNQVWESYRNIYPVVGNPVGLSGIALFTKNKDFAIEIKMKDVVDDFQTIKIITPQNENMFDLATSSKIITLESTQSKVIQYKIKKGDALSTIAGKHNISVVDLKKANKLSSNNIIAGATLKIPTKEKEKKSLQRSEFIPFVLQKDSLTHFYKSKKGLDRVYLLPNKKAENYALNGLILERNQSGVLYHNIGVNGAKFSDYNKYPLFFEQLKTVQPDLIVLSLGTNESFDKMTTVNFVNQMNLFLSNLKREGIDAVVLITTPPPSLFQKKFPNIFVADYSQVLLKHPTVYPVAVWDLFTLFGGLYGIDQNYNNGLMAKDRVHYSKRGYIQQGQLLSEAIINAYSNFKNPVQN